MATATDCMHSNPAPILLSPISVAHRSQILDAEGVLSPGNAIREQWMANLLKKRAAAADGTGAPIGNGNPSASSVQSSHRAQCSHRSSSAKKSSRSRSASSRTAKMRSAYEKNLLAHSYSHDQIAVMSPGLIIDSQIAINDRDTQAYGHPSMLFNGLDCFGLESPSFSQLISSSLDGEFPLALTDATRTGKSRSKRLNQADSKKRSTYCLAVEVDASKPRTPRRKLNSGLASFDEFDLEYRPTSVGTPSNLRLETSTSTRHLWGHDMDLSPGGDYADTFLDVATPTSNQLTNNSAASRSESNDNQMESWEQPRLVRTNSVEQEGLSSFLEHTNLDRDTRGHQEFPLATAPLLSGRKSPFSGGSFFPGSVTPRSAAAAVEECFGRSSYPSWPVPSPSCSKARCMNPRDLKHAPEFGTFSDEYKLTDIDHELDSFYLDTMESLGNDLNLISN